MYECSFQILTFGPFYVWYKITKHMQQHLYGGIDGLTWNFAHKYWVTNHINFEYNKCHSTVCIFLLDTYLSFPMKSSKNLDVMSRITIARLYFMWKKITPFTEVKDSTKVLYWNFKIDWGFIVKSISCWHVLFCCAPWRSIKRLRELSMV